MSIEVGWGGEPADGRVDGVRLAVAPLKYPLQHAAILAIARPQELAVFVLTEPVHVINLRQLRWLELRADLEPVCEVITHVVAAEREHGHGVAAELADCARSRGCRFAAGSRAQKSAVLPVEGFSNQGDDARTPATEEDGVDGHAFRILPLWRDDWALLGLSGKPRVGMGRFTGRCRSPRPSQPVDQFGGFIVRHPLPPHVTIG